MSKNPWTKDGTDDYSDANLNDEGKTRLRVRGGIDGEERFHWKHNPLPMKNGHPTAGGWVLIIIVVIILFALSPHR